MIAVAGDGEFAVFLDGDPAAAAPVSENDIVDAAMRLAAVFLQLRRDDQSVARMKDAVVRHGSAAIFASGRSRVGAGCRPRRADPSLFLLSDRSHIRAAYSRQVWACRSDALCARELEALCRIGSSLGITVANTSPERVLVFPVDDPDASDRTIGRSGEAAAHHRRARPASRDGCLSRRTGMPECQHRNAPRRAAPCRCLAG